MKLQLEKKGSPLGETIGRRGLKFSLFAAFCIIPKDDARQWAGDGRPPAVAGGRNGTHITISNHRILFFPSIKRIEY